VVRLGNRVSNVDHTQLPLELSEEMSKRLVSR
jgi:hypothetical protein